MHTNLIFAVVIYQGFLSQSTGKNSRLFVMTLFEPLAWACSIQFGLPMQSADYRRFQCH